MRRADADVVSYLENGRANADGDEERAAYDRAADYVRALSNPPETVEELEQKVHELDGNIYATAFTRQPLGDYVVAWPDQRVVIAPNLRAAWFAIVGLEVGRGD